MPTQNRTRTTDRTAARERRAARAAQTEARGANRAQIQAMEIRAAETRAGTAEVAVGSAMAANAAANEIGTSVRRAITASKRVIARPVVLTKDQEYRFIRSDLRRLLVTAGALFVLMIVLLFIVD